MTGDLSKPRRDPPSTHGLPVSPRAEAENAASPAALLAEVYGQLRSVAQQRMKEERRGHTLDATALVHEAYLRLADETRIPWKGRAHFFAAAAQAMRRVLVEHARARGAVKRGGSGNPARSREIPLNVIDLAVDADADEILAVDEAIFRLESQDADLARIVRLRFFAGLSEDEVAQALEMSPRTVRRDWTVARAWLRRELRGAAED